MPPSWLQRLSVDHGGGTEKVTLPELERADWSRALNGGGSSIETQTSAASTFAEGLLSTSGIALHGEVSALAVEPVLGFLAVGTTVGGLHLFGANGVQVDWNIRPANKVQHLVFKSGSPILVVIDVKDNISVFDISRNDPQVRAKANAAPHPFQPTQSTTTGAGPSGPLHPDTPMRIGAHTARNGVLCVEVSPLHSHLLIGLRDGTIDAYDLERLSPSPYRVPNLWWEEEEILRKSGVPDAPSRRHVPLLIDIKTRPNDINQLLLAYEGGVVLLDLGKRNVLKTFQLRHLPGVPGPGVGDPNMVWTERAAPVTCVAWRPDGLVFACGHEDGCISFWHVEDDEKPIAVRTLESMDVDRPGVDERFMSGHLPRSREPVFKLAWSGFPSQSWLTSAAAKTDTRANPASPRQQQASLQSPKEEPATGTILTVLGGATERHPPGLVCLHYPPFSWPYASYWNAKTPDAIAKTRQALRASLDETKGSRYSTVSAVEDFLLIPRDSPYYGNVYDPIAVITLLAQDPALPPLPPPATSRGLKAFAFPPPSSDTRSASIPTAHRDPGLGLTQSSFAQRELNLPLPLSTSGSGAVLGAKLIDITPHVHRTLTAEEVNSASGADKVDSTTSPAFDSIRNAIHTVATGEHTNVQQDALPLRGGRATPTASGTHAQTAEAFATLARAHRWRLLVTWHLDGTVRFHDASPHLLLVGADQSAMLNTQDGKEAFTPGHLTKSFPQPLTHLTIDIRGMLYQSSMNGHPLFERLKSDTSRTRIVDAHVAAEAMEVAVTLRTGQVLHYKFGFARFSQTDEFRDAVAEEVQQDEEMAARLARRSSNVMANPSLATTAELDESMAGAMMDLGVAPGGNVPPARPRRDPKRLTSPPQPAFSHQQPPPRVHVDEITHLGHLADWRTDGFKPNIAIELGRGEASAVDLSDIGFLTIACGPALAVLDMRGPAIIVREGFGRGDGVREDALSREERKMMDEESKSSIQTVRLAICRSAADPVLSPTLIVVRESGYTTLWTLIKTPTDTWTCLRTHGQYFDELQAGVDIQVVDMAGNLNRAIPAELQRSLREQMRGGALASEAAAMDMNLMLCVGRTAITLRNGICGSRVGKTELNGGEVIRAASVVDRRGDKVVVAVTLKSIYVFSLPKLRLITRVQRHNRAHEQRLTIAQATLSLDTSGDFVEVANSVDVCLWTVFASMPRAGLPSLLLYTPPSMPLAPNMLGSVASSVVNWIGGKTTALTQGAQLDELLAGGSGKRASMPKLPEQKYVQEKSDERERKAAVQEELARRAESAQTTNRVAFSRTSAPSTSTVRTGQQANDAASSAAWTFDLAKQRGEMVNSLEQGLSNLERGASDWMKSAREQMIKQAAKDKISKFF